MKAETVEEVGVASFSHGRWCCPSLIDSERMQYGRMHRQHFEPKEQPVQKFKGKVRQGELERQEGVKQERG